MLVAVGLSLVLSLAGDLTLYTILPIYAASLMIPLGAIGLFLSANRLVRLVSNPIAGVFYDRFRRRPLILIGLTLGAISSVCCAFPEIRWLFLSGRFLWGISWSLIYIGSYCIVVDITDLKERGWGVGILMAFYFIGLSLNPLLGGAFASLFGFSHAMLLSASISCLGLLIAIVFIPETRIKPELAIWKFYSSWSNAKFVLPSITSRWLARNLREIAGNFIYFLTLFVGEGIILSTLTLHLKQNFYDLQFSKRLVDISLAGGTLLAIRALVASLSAPISGYLSDRSRNQWIFISGALLTGAIGCFLLARFGQIATTFMGVILTSASGSVIATLIPAMISSLVSANRTGQALGILNTAGDVGSAIAPLAAYSLLTVIPLESIYLICAGLLIAGTVAACFVQ